MAHVRARLGVSERRACRVLGQPRSTQRHVRTAREDEAALTSRIVDLASEYGRYGYRRVTGMLRLEGRLVNHKRVERIWRAEGLKVPQRQPKRSRLWLADGSCLRLRPTHKDHVWAYDFVFTRTHDGRPLKLLTLVDEHTRECLAIDVARKMTSEHVLARLQLAVGAQRLEGGERRDADRGRLLEGDVGRLACHGVRGCGGELGEGSLAGPEHLVADCQTGVHGTTRRKTPTTRKA